MNNRDYSPREMFKLIKTDNDATNLLNIYVNRLSMAKRLWFIMLVGLVAIGVSSFLFDFSTSPVLSKYLFSMFFVFFLGILLDSIFMSVCYTYVVALQPLSLDKYQSNVLPLTMDYPEAHSIWIGIHKDRQLYQFDLDFISDTIQYLEPDMSFSLCQVKSV